MKTIAIINQKGGVGKTACAYNLAYCFATKEKKTLLVDLDPSGNATRGLLNGTYLKDAYTIKDVILQKCDPMQAIIGYSTDDDIKPLFVMPSRIDLAMASRELVNKPYRETLLYRQLYKLNTKFDYCLIDCSPTLSDLTVNAILAADLILIPVTYEEDALEGMNDLFNVIKEIKEEREYQFKIIRNQKDSRKKKTNEYIEGKLSDFVLGGHVLETIIRQDEAINQAKIEGVSIFTFAPHSNGAKDFTQLTEELLS